MTSEEAYHYALENHHKSSFDLNHYQKIVCKRPYWAYYFARNIPGANIKYCQEHACTDPKNALFFALDISDADIEYCRKACECNEYYLNLINQFIIRKVML